MHRRKLAAACGAVAALGALATMPLAASGDTFYANRCSQGAAGPRSCEIVPVVRCVVVAVAGLPVAIAEDELVEHNCRVGTIGSAVSWRVATGDVIASTPGPRAPSAGSWPAGHAVGLTVSRPSVTARTRHGRRARRARAGR